MGIKLVKNFEEGRYSSINSDFLLQILDNNKQLDKFSGKSFFVFNPTTNERFEVMPEVAKYDFARYFFLKMEQNYTIFTSCKQLNEQDIEIQFYKYDIDTNSSKIFFTKVVKLNSLNETLFIKVFSLPEDFCLIEFIDIESQDDKYELYIMNYYAKKPIQVNNKLINQYGLDRLITLKGNLCAIKIGDEIIGTVNINRFVSDMAIGLENIYIDVLDSGNGQFNMPFMRIYSNRLTYVKHDCTSDNEEIVIYDYENKVKKVRFGTVDDEVSNLKKLYVINDVPYYFLDRTDGVSIINLNNQKTEAELYNNMEIVFVSGDLIVTRKSSWERLFSQKAKDIIEVFKYPDVKHPVYRTKGHFGCCLEHYDNLLIFVG